MGRFTTQTHGSGPARVKSIEKYAILLGPHKSSAAWTDASLLRSYKYQKLKRGEDPIQRALEQHSLTKDGLAYNND